ncbi:uncharacterized protein M421DRAFT_9531 [Didymella exigua CBS 183.55]|uniref:Uncharacterized protein n=1 Tax=Didymella exigua CBS 183.55 TaxID=1150837 RepID=A0A6A5R8P3_9PLEO|nr:uncharacterized protein M421DRAFT_9531 [Didymella exigua CBS 183.55]KAF1923580.1 hypothetical protein M421DRAFT_9531 [Didymella exigua CBS 183.55]
MTALVATMRPLPADLAITERSRKFYDGTYKWDSDGFYDEHGVYREYDCLDPLAHAPTPRPPMFLDDEDDVQIELATTGPAQPLSSSSTVTLTKRLTVEPDTPCPAPENTMVTDEARRSPGSIHRFAVDLLSTPKQSKMAYQGKFDAESQTTKDAVDGLRDFEPGSEPGEIVEILHRSHDICEESSPAKRESNSVKMPEMPPASPVKTVSILQNVGPASTISTLSSASSKLSDGEKDEDIKIKGAFTAQNSPSLPSTLSKTSPPKKQGATTRGVAQKATKSSKRASVSKSIPPNRKENSVEEFTLLELHSGSFLREGSLRKSARQVKLKGK